MIVDRISKQVFIDFMTKDQSDPVVILQEIVSDMLDNKKYRSYTDSEEWQHFFAAMTKIVK